MKPNSFNEKDKEKVINFLNMVAQHAKFEFNVDQTIKFYGLLAHMQTEILKKIDSNILEIRQYIEPAQPKEPAKAKGKK